MVNEAGYDRVGATFSPDGRLFQVEYAREAVKRGTTVIGIEYLNGVMLLTDKRITSRLLKERSVKKIFQIDKHIIVATSGLVADARKLIDVGRSWVQENKIVYDEPINVETLAEKICDHKQIFTQQGGLRPFGVGMLIAGVDHGETHLFETDPSGALLEYKATAVGSGKAVVEELLDKEYKEDMKIEDAILLGLKALYAATEGKMNNQTVDIGLIEIETGEFKFLNQKDIELYTKKTKKDKEKGEG